MWHNATHPLQSSDPTLDYGSNQGHISKDPTKKNAEILRENMKVGKTPGIDAHHIVPSTHSNQYARDVRELLEKWNIDINEAENGVLLPRNIHNGLANDHTYMRAVYNDLSQANTREEAIEILQDIGERLLNGTYPRAGR